MDVKRGYCWRCENKITTTTPCPTCGVAKYCTKKCCYRDHWRHKQECENWKPKQCSNCNSYGQLLECAGCCNAWYCDEKCQRTHWKRHKPTCHERMQEIKEAVPKLGFNFESMAGTPLLSPYYIGNALAVDMLNLEENECCVTTDESEANTTHPDPLTRDYSILSCGSGNLRNWILTAASLPVKFSGKLHTTLNDFDPFMQARNVLHLYMMIAHQDEDDIADSITSIWYSLHLSEKDYKLLTKCLTALQGLTACDLKRITKGVLSDINDDDLKLMREVWEVWQTLECRKGQRKYIDLQKQRRDLMLKTGNAAEGQQLYRNGLPNSFLPSYDKHCQNGDFYGSGKQQLMYDNPTMTGYFFPEHNKSTLNKLRAERIAALSHPNQHQFVYCIEAHLSVFFEWDFLQVKKHHYNKSLVVMFHSHVSEQIKKVISHLKANRLSVSIDVWNCLELGARRGHSKFDRIFTSNIADFSGTQPLLKALKPFLNESNKCSAICTQYWNWYGYFLWAMVGGPLGSDSAAVTRASAVMSCGFDGTRDMYADNDEMQEKLKNHLLMLQESKKVIDRGHFFSQEYFNCMIWFVSYLRADLMAFDGPQSISKAPPSFQKVKHSQGLILRDFRKGELNKVTPYRFRRNVRTVNLMRGMERVLEWHLPTA